MADLAGLVSPATLFILTTYAMRSILIMLIHPLYSLVYLIALVMIPHECYDVYLGHMCTRWHTLIMVN